MYLIGFLRSVLVFLVSLIGLWLFTVRRERCQLKFLICIAVSLVFQYIIYYLMFTEDIDVQGIPLSKILTFLMMSLLIFWGGLYVYEGWYRVGIYFFCVDLFLGVTDRIYWAVWEMITHRTVNQSIVYYEGNKIIESNSFLMYLLNYIFLIPLLIGAHKLRNRTLRPVWLMKTVVIIYLILGASPLVTRPGFEEASGVTNSLSVLVGMLVWAVMFFLLITTMSITATRESRRILYIRKQVMTEQNRLLMAQKEKMRRLRHDVKKHLSNLDYILEKEPDLCSDPAVLRYRELLNENEEWMKKEVYCDSSIMNLCFEQIKRYCGSEGITLDIVLKRLDFSAWEKDDQLMFGTLLLDLLEMFGSTRSIVAVHFSGDKLMGQNILRFTMEMGGNEGRNQRKLIYNLEKDIRLVLSKYRGKMERADEGDQLEYIITWED